MKNNWKKKRETEYRNKGEWRNNPKKIILKSWKRSDVDASSDVTNTFKPHVPTHLTKVDTIWLKMYWRQ